MRASIILQNGFFMRKNNIGIVGLGYVGLPLAVNLSKYFNVFGFDISKERLKNLKQNLDTNYELSKQELKKCRIHYSNMTQKKDINIDTFIITVPTPVDNNNKPNISSLLKACKFVGKMIKKKHLIIIESTVAPGTTENQCLNLISKISNIHKKKISICFSPERINPGDKQNQLKHLKKIVSANSKKSLIEAIKIYKKITKDIVIADSIKSAEFAKIVENSQRDINISFMNEIYKICDVYKLNYNHVLDLCNTKWNFINFKPGLVGGHCVPVDPYYLIEDLKKKRYSTKLLSLSRKTNELFVNYITKKLLKILRSIKIKKLLFCGVNFKNNVNDTRNSKYFLIYQYIKKKYKCDLFSNKINNSKQLSQILKNYNVYIFGSNNNNLDRLRKQILKEKKGKKTIVNILSNKKYIHSKNIEVINI